MLEPRPAPLCFGKSSPLRFGLSPHPFSIAGWFTFLPVIHAARTIHNQDEQRQRSPPCMGRQISTRSSTRSATTGSTRLSSQSSVIVSSTLGTQFITMSKTRSLLTLAKCFNNFYLSGLGSGECLPLLCSSVQVNSLIHVHFQYY